MLAYFGAIGFAIVLWWFSTVAILYLDHRSPRTFLWSMAFGTVLLILAIWGIIETSGDTSAISAYVGFTCGIVVWGWQLLSFYLGYITGPRTEACEAGLNGWPRFREGVRTSLYHELVVIGFGLLLVVICWNEPNKSALWTYLVLYWMHQSAKLNLFFGALNHGEELLPANLRYLASFMKRKPMNLMFPLSVTLSTVVTVLLAQSAAGEHASYFELSMFTMLACLMALAVLEHWFLVLPLPVDAFWQFGLSAREEGFRQDKFERTSMLTRPDAPQVYNLQSNGHSYASDFDDPAPKRYSHIQLGGGLPNTFVHDAARKRTA